MCALHRINDFHHHENLNAVIALRCTLSNFIHSFQYPQSEFVSIEEISFVARSFLEPGDLSIYLISRVASECTARTPKGKLGSNNYRKSLHTRSSSQVRLNAHIACFILRQYYLADSRQIEVHGFLNSSLSCFFLWHSSLLQ